jgi:hypothetical protein
MRTDQYRFSDPNYVRSLLEAYWGLSCGPLSPEQTKMLNEEMLQFGEYYKGILDILTNLLQVGIAKSEMAVFVSLVVKNGASPKLFLQVMSTTLQLVREGRLGKDVIQRCVQESSSIGKKLAALNSNSGRVLIFLVVLQVGFHLKRGDYPKAIAEIGKTALCGLVAPMALIDLVDSIIGFLLPAEWAKWPPIRVIRGLNPAQCSSMIIENISYLVYIFGMARQRNWTKVAAAVEKMCAAIENSPAGIYTYLARDTAMLMDELVLPNWVSETEIFGASIRNLADYARANPHSAY